MDDELIGLITERPRRFVIPNLPERRHRGRVRLAGETVPPREIPRLRTAAASRTPAAARQARELFEVQARNLAPLNAAGVRIAYGTDAGVSIGWNALTELSDMVAAGMTPAQVLTAATRRRPPC